MSLEHSLRGVQGHVNPDRSLQCRSSSSTLVWYLIKNYTNVPKPLIGISIKDILRGLKRKCKGERAERLIFPLECSVSNMMVGIFESLRAEFLLASCNLSSQEVLRSRGFFKKCWISSIVLLLHLNENLPEICKHWNVLFIFIAQSLFSSQCGSKSL